MTRHIAPMPCKPWTMNGLSEQLIVAHYEEHYGPAVRSLNAIRDALAAVDLATAPSYQILGLKREEVAAANSVALHEAYFESLGGDGTAVFTGTGLGSGMPPTVAAALERSFGGAAAWRREFTAAAAALRGGPGWVLLNYSPHDGGLSNQIAVEHAAAMIGAVPLLALDMYEHAYQLDFGANAAAYVDTFMRNINWTTVESRVAQAGADVRPAHMPSGDIALPSVAVEELATQLAQGAQIQVLDARPKHHFTKSADMMRGAIWRDPNLVDEWSHELAADRPVFVYCSYGFNVGCGVTATLRERGFDAKFIRGGLSAWYATGGPRALKPQSNA